MNKYIDPNIRARDFLPVAILADPEQKIAHKKALRDTRESNSKSVLWNIQQLTPNQETKFPNLTKMVNFYLDDKLKHAFQTFHWPPITLVK